MAWANQPLGMSLSQVVYTTDRDDMAAPPRSAAFQTAWGRYSGGTCRNVPPASTPATRAEPWFNTASSASLKLTHQKCLCIVLSNTGRIDGSGRRGLSKASLFVARCNQPKFHVSSGRGTRVISQSGSCPEFRRLGAGRRVLWAKLPGTSRRRALEINAAKECVA